jgi:hypothetical protein
MKNSVYSMALSVCAAFFLFTQCEKREQKCVVKGVLPEGGAKSLNLIKSTKDPRSNKRTIPVVDGNFSFELASTDVEAYTLYFDDDIYYPIVKFFPDQDQITMTLYPPGKQKENVIDGGLVNEEYGECKMFVDSASEKANKEYQPVWDSINSLQREEKYYTPAMTALYKALGKSKSGEENNMIYEQMDSLREKGLEFTEPAKQLEAEILDFRRGTISSVCDYAEKNPSIASYYILIEHLLLLPEQALDFGRIEQVQKELAERFKNHPYNRLTESILGSMKTFNVGSEYVDFSLPDMEGNSHIHYQN